MRRCRSGPACLRPPSVHISTDEQKQSPVGLPVYLLKDNTRVCLLFYPLCLWVWSSNTLPLQCLLILDWVCSDYAIDPVDVMGHTGINPGLILLPAPITPADHTHQSHLAIVSTDKWTTGVSLCVKSNKTKRSKGKKKRLKKVI